MIDESRPKGFLIMPFADELDWLHEEIIDASLKEGVDTERADSIFAPGAILQQILGKIDAADVIFAVCTGKNANVFFELGYAWRHHTPILIANDTDDLPFDVSAFRTELYGREQRGADRHSLNLRLRRAIREALNSESLPRGRILNSPPSRKSEARLTAKMMDTGRSRRLVVSNVGTETVNDVDVHVPKDASSFSVHKGEELPLDTLRPGESFQLPAMATMGGGRRIFDIQITGILPDGEEVEFYSKISL